MFNKNTIISFVTVAAFSVLALIINLAASNAAMSAKPFITASPDVVAEAKKEKKEPKKPDASKLDTKFDYLPEMPDGQRLELSWHDEFDGDKLDTTKWTAQGDGPRKGGFWLKETVELDGKGKLVIKVINKDGKYAGGSITSRKKFRQAFGYFVARCKLQKQPGHWSAFWLNTETIGSIKDEGRDGAEIDIMEKPWLTDHVQHTLHWDGYTKKHHKQKGKKVKFKGVMEGYHTFSLLWTPEEYIFYIDGKETWRTKAGGVCQVPAHILLSEEVGKWAGDIKKAKLPDAFYCDYVRVYKIVNTKEKDKKDAAKK